MKNKWFHTFLNAISVFWNAYIFVQDLNSGRRANDGNHYTTKDYLY